MENFYDVHCPNCGKVLQADQMAFNIDQILRTHLSKIRQSGSTPLLVSAKEAFREIQLGIYLTKNQLEQDGLLAPGGTLRITCRNIFDLLEKNYGVDISGITENGDEEDEELLDGDQDAFELDDPYADSWDAESGGSDFEIPQHLLDRLCLQMRFYGQAGEDEKRSCILNMLQALLSGGEETLLECRLEPVEAEDDRGRHFTASCRVTYTDGETAAYNHMACPDCGEPFFLDAGKYEERIIVMLGSSRVGKTAYLAALADMLNPEYGQPRYPSITIKDTPDRKYTYFKEQILRQYRDGKKILKTDERRDAAALFSLDVLIGGRMVILTFVDLPGEVFVPRSEEEKQAGEASGRFIMNHRKICYSADLFWFCIDPVQIDQRLSRMNESAGADQVEQDINLVLSNIETVLQLMGSGKADTPTAVIITKSDLAAEEAGIFFKGTEPEFLHENVCFRNDRCKMTAARVRQYLLSNNVKNILPKLERMFGRKNYFAAAAYGCSVEGDEGVNKEPSGIILPFLWSLSALGYLQPVEYVLRTGRKETGRLWKGLGILGAKDSAGDAPGCYEEADREELFA